MTAKCLWRTSRNDTKNIWTAQTRRPNRNVICRELKSKVETSPSYVTKLTTEKNHSVLDLTTEEGQRSGWYGKDQFENTMDNYLHINLSYQAENVFEISDLKHDIYSRFSDLNVIR